MTIQTAEPRILRGRFTRALVLENPDPTLDGFLKGYGFEVERIDDPPAEEDALIEILERFKPHLIFKRSRVEITERVIQATPSLFGVMLCCIGDDSVDKEACARGGVMVVNDPISNGRSVAEMVIGEIICLSRRIFEATADTDNNKWNKSGTARYEVQGKTLGIVGLGNIGKQVAQLGEALGMRIVFHDNREVPQEVGGVLGWRSAATMEELFEQSHVVTVHLSATDHSGNSNQNVLTASTLAALGRAAGPGPRIFINAARGFVYEPGDLIAAVKAGAIEYACVDVFPREPHHKGEVWVNPYAEIKGVYGTPHIGAATQEAQPRIARHVATSTRNFSHQGRIRDCIFSPKAPLGLADGELPPYVLAVVHSDQRGTKKAIDETIYDAGLSNLSSAHRDFPAYGIAYDVSGLDGPLEAGHIEAMIARANAYTGATDAIRSVRVIKTGA